MRIGIIGTDTIFMSTSVKSVNATTQNHMVAGQLQDTALVQAADTLVALVLPVTASIQDLNDLKVSGADATMVATPTAIFEQELHATARVFSGMARDAKLDLVVVDHYGIGLGSNIFASLLAGLLDWPVYTEVNILRRYCDAIKIARVLEDGQEAGWIGTPAILSLSKDNNVLSNDVDARLRGSAQTTPSRSDVHWPVDPTSSIGVHREVLSEMPWEPIVREPLIIDTNGEEDKTWWAKLISQLDGSGTLPTLTKAHPPWGKCHGPISVWGEIDRRTGKVTCESLALVAEARRLVGPGMVAVILQGPTSIEQQVVFVDGADRIVWVADSNAAPMAVAEVIVTWMKQARSSLLLLPTTIRARELAGLVSAVGHYPVVDNILDFVVDKRNQDPRLACIRATPHATEVVRCLSEPFVGLIVSGAFSLFEGCYTGPHTVHRASVPRQRAAWGRLNYHNDSRLFLPPVDYNVVMGLGDGLEPSAIDNIREGVNTLGIPITISSEIGPHHQLPSFYEVGERSRFIVASLYIALEATNLRRHLAGIRQPKKVIAVTANPSPLISPWSDVVLYGSWERILLTMMENWGDLRQRIGSWS